MSKLSTLKSSPDVGLAKRPADVCLSPNLATELEAADQHLFACEQQVADLRAALDRDAAAGQDSETPKHPRRAGQSANADLKQQLADAEAAAEEAAHTSDAVRARMREHTVTLMLQGKTNGEWRRWVAQHPAREAGDNPAGWDRDRKHAGGFCNLDDLIDDLHLWIAAYDDEPPTEEWWEFVSANGVPGDLRDAASVVVRMHEQVVDPGKSRVDWLANRRSAPASR